MTSEHWRITSHSSILDIFLPIFPETLSRVFIFSKPVVIGAISALDNPLNPNLLQVCSWIPVSVSALDFPRHRFSQICHWVLFKISWGSALKRVANPFAWGQVSPRWLICSHSSVIKHIQILLCNGPYCEETSAISYIINLWLPSSSPKWTNSFQVVLPWAREGKGGEAHGHPQQTWAEPKDYSLPKTLQHRGLWCYGLLLWYTHVLRLL
jgi:hypothetical protein